MAYIRINATVRDTVVDGLLKHKFSVQENKLEEEKAELDARDLSIKKMAYEAIYGVQAAKMLAVPDGWMEKTDNVRAEVEGQGRIQVKFDKDYPVPQTDLPYNKAAAILDPDCAYMKAVREHETSSAEWYERRKELNSENIQLRNRALAIINSVTTVKRLLEVWPEVEEFLPEENSGPAGGVPAVLIEDLNKAFGLKRGE